MNFFAENIMIVMFLPIWVCLIILSGMFFKIVGNNKITFIITILSSLICLIFSVGALNAITLPQSVVVEQSYELLSVGNFHICAGTVVNTISCISLIVLMTVMLFVQIYSYVSLKNKKLFNVCFICLNYLNFALAGLILATNLIQFFIFQASIGIVIYLLSSLYNQKENEDKSLWFVILNAISDASLLIGITLFSYFSLRYMNLSPVEFLSFNNLENLKDALDVLLYPEVYGYLIIPFILYTVIKMSLFPFQQHLNSINNCISPVSAIINSVFLTYSGIYLLMKIYPVIPYYILDLLLKAGIISALLFAFILTAQKDVRKILSYIVSVQTALITVLICIGAISSAVVASVIFIFTIVLTVLCLNEVINISGEVNTDNICGIKQADYPLSVYWVVSALSLSGICFGGFTQKDAIIKAIKSSCGNFLFISVMLVYFLSAYALFRVYYYIFEGENKFEKPNKNRYKTFCFMTLCLFVILPGFMFNISNMKIFILDILISLISILAIFIAYALYKTRKNLLPPFINNIAEKEIFVPNIYNFLFGVMSKILNIVKIFEKNILDSIFKFVFIPFVAVFKKTADGQNIFIQKIWLILYIAVIIYIFVCLYNYMGRIY